MEAEGIGQPPEPKQSREQNRTFGIIEPHITGPKISEERIKAHSGEILKQIDKVNERSLSTVKFQEYLNTAKADGFPIEQLTELLESHGVKVYHSEELSENKTIIDTEIKGGSLSQELRVNEEDAVEIVQQFLDNGDYASLGSSDMKTGKEAIVGFVQHEGREYVIKESLSTEYIADVSIPVYGHPYKNYGQKIEQAQISLDEKGVSGYAPMTKVKVGERELFVQRKIKGDPATQNEVFDAYKQAGVDIVDPKGNIVLYKDKDGVIRPVLIDLGWVAK